MATSVDSAAPSRATGGNSFRAWLGPIIAIGAVGCALATFLVVAQFGISPTDSRIFPLLAANGLFVGVLLIMVVVKAMRLYRVWRRGEAAARLHVRTVGLFSVIALIPAIVLAIAGSLTLERALNPAFMANVKVFVHNTAKAAEAFQSNQCQSLLQEAQMTASDLDRAAKALFTQDKTYFHQIFASRATVLGFSVAALVKSTGEIVDRIDVAQNAAAIVIAPPQSEFDNARRNEPLCLVIDEGKSFVALRALSSMPDTFLYVTRPVDPFAIEFPKEAQTLISNYDAFDAYRMAVQRAFVLMYALLTTIMLLSSIWFGLDFADRLVTPIRTLIAATDQVSAGNLDVQVDVDKAQGDLARLGEVFNNMTSELHTQQSRLLEANRINDERREFTEAVLAGVPAAVVGVNSEGIVTILNRSAEDLSIARGRGQIVGAVVTGVMPEVVPILRDAAEVFPRSVQSQITLKRGGAERTFNVRVTSARAQEGHPNFVITLDDITDLVTAQRSSAWADVARRIAHEIKNPLTPIQLSAERLKRKYGKVIVTDRGVFDQCIDTIVRQVDDIKRMVDEFSSFARMPKARPERDDLNECIRQVAFLMRVGNAEIEFVERLPDRAVHTQFDRRLLSQALTNIVKNAVEGIAAREESDAQDKGRVEISLIARNGFAEIDVIDNGKGFPAVNRQRLLEPYMTTRSDGTGLGLPIVAKIIEDHGGRLELLDAPEGRGACVRLILPLAEANIKEATAVASDKQPARSAAGQGGT